MYSLIQEGDFFFHFILHRELQLELMMKIRDIYSKKNLFTVVKCLYKTNKYHSFKALVYKTCINVDVEHSIPQFYCPYTIKRKLGILSTIGSSTAYLLETLFFSVVVAVVVVSFYKYQRNASKHGVDKTCKFLKKDIYLLFLRKIVSILNICYIMLKNIFLQPKTALLNLGLHFVHKFHSSFNNILTGVETIFAAK